MDSAPKDGARIILRCLDGEEDDRSARRVAQFGQWRDGGCFGVKAIDWYNDSGSWVEPDGWLPSPDVVEEETIEPEPVPMSLKDFVAGDLGSMGCPVPWNLLKDSPVSVASAIDVGFSAGCACGIYSEHRSEVLGMGGRERLDTRKPDRGVRSGFYFI